MFGHGVSGRDLVLIVGGLFLLAKSTHEIHDKLEGEGRARLGQGGAVLPLVLIQIMLLDIVFSLDSVITAVGMVSQLPVMVTAVIVAVGFMLFFATAISDFVHRHPTVKMLALSFLLMIGVMLVADGFGQHIPRATCTSPWPSRCSWRCSTSACAPSRASRSTCTSLCGRATGRSNIGRPWCA